MNDDGPEYDEAYFATTQENVAASGMGKAYNDYVSRYYELNLPDSKH